MAGGRKLSTRSRALIFNDDEVVALLQAAIEREGGQSAFARRYGVNRSHMNRFLKGKVTLGPTIARVLGLRQVYVADRQYARRIAANVAKPPQLLAKRKSPLEETGAL